MTLILEYVLTNILLAISPMYIWHLLLNKKINFKNYKLYISVIGITISAILIYLLVNKFLKITLITLVFIFFFRYLFKEKIQKCIITPIFYQLIIMISETIYALFLTIVLKFDTEILVNSFIGTFLTNIIVAVLSIIIAKISIIQLLYRKIVKMTESVKTPHLIFLCLLLVLISNILAMTMYYKIKLQYLLIFNVSLTIVCGIIVFYSFKTKNSYNKVYDKYNIAINSLKDYEDMMSKYRLSNHENKNLLLAVRAMIINKEKDIPKYIDSIIKNKYNDNEKLLMKVNVIPSGGLRATIYSEILKIKDNNIDYNLYIDKNLKAIDLIELDTNTIIDICKIIGVFIDNAIDEITNQKNGKIGINLFLEENYLNIEVSNNYNKPIEIEKIYDQGYTTKGKGHGYGLSLVKKIVNRNNIFENKISIDKTIFTQILIIKYKKSR